ncbi:AMP-binding protein [Modicisalibacter xianhensis]|uniref:Long-chain acyl-CoA synthetase (AMP-forming) n=1 Tax=Modicisalibacter xianhensis TaxID=442341 RepID=A0A1I2ZZM7_9GAMM|nr:Long-chain acyl-CoA synthetase (AMP-forming) [Halomonas xianhensis]
MPSPSSLFIERLTQHARETPHRVALHDGSRQLRYGDLINTLVERRHRLARLDARRVALALDNGVEWALWDLALLLDGRVAVPVPGFFSHAQRQHLVTQAGLDAWIGPGGDALGFATSDDAAIAIRPVETPPYLHAGTTRITFTSGTSGTPKGVCLDAKAPLQVTASLSDIVGPLGIERHLAMLPLATLLENIGGIYVPLWLGATACLPSLATTGLQGASAFSPDIALTAIDTFRPNSLILVPQLLQALIEASPQAPESLRFVAVGGARVSESLLSRAHEGGWPVYQGYGLSECASVVCLNRPGEQAQGVGRLLPHAQARITTSGEVLINGATMLGYLGEPAASDWHPSGDLGHWHGDSLVLDGRRREMFITAFGRNVDPQWVEGELLLQRDIAQALVHGEALPSNRALIVPATPETTDVQLACAIATVNRTLPDYARIGTWRRCAPFTPHNQQLTANGRLRRDTLLAGYGEWLLAPHIPTEKVTAMSAYQMLQDATHEERNWLLSAPLLTRAQAGKVSLAEYLGFLTQAYHHVRFTVPLMMDCGAHLPDRLNWLRAALVEYIEEEHGHEQWILDDIRAAGGDAEAAARSNPHPATQLMVSYVRDVINHGNPVGFFGMVQVLEGTSTALATQAAEQMQASLALPNDAVRYLTSHGDLDIGHIAFFEGLVNRLENDDLQAVIETARMVYRLYGAMFRGIEANSNGGSAVRELTNALV